MNCPINVIHKTFNYLETNDLARLSVTNKLFYLTIKQYASQKIGDPLKMLHILKNWNYGKGFIDETCQMMELYKCEECEWLCGHFITPECLGCRKRICYSCVSKMYREENYFYCGKSDCPEYWCDKCSSFVKRCSRCENVACDYHIVNNLCRNCWSK